jgi:hypothetical protein
MRRQPVVHPQLVVALISANFYALYRGLQAMVRKSLTIN